MIAVLGPRMGETLQGGHQPARVGNENPMRVPAGMFRRRTGSTSRSCRTISRSGRGFAARSVIWNGSTIRVRDACATRRESRGGPRSRSADVSATGDFAGAGTGDLRPNVCPLRRSTIITMRSRIEHVTERGLVLEVEHPKSGRIKLVGPPWKSSIPSPPLEPPPVLGNDLDEVLQDWLGTKTRSVRAS